MSAAAERRTGPILALLCTAQFLVVLDFSIVNVAIQPIARDLGMQPATLQWVVSAYALTFGGLLLLGGRAADLFGRRRLLVAGLALFCAGSALGGAAQSGPVLIAARALQGVGAAAVSPAALSLITTAFTEGRGRNRALAAWSAVGAGGIAAGVVLGGVLVEIASWRWVLWVNVPLALLLGGLVLGFVAESRDDDTDVRALDVPGAVLSTLGVTGVLYGLTRAEKEGYDALVVIGPAAAGLALLGAFLWAESRARRPLVPLRVLRLRTLRGANGSSLAAAAVFAAMFFLLSLHLREELELSALATGLVFLPAGLVNALVSTVVGARLVPRFGARRILVGAMVVLALGMALLGATLGTGSAPALLPGMLLMAVGMGLAHPAFTIAGVAGVEDDDQGCASGLITTTQQVGSALGLALLVPVSTVLGVSEALFAGVVLALLGAVLAAWVLESRDLRSRAARG